MTGRPALVTRYAITLTAAHFPVGTEEYEVLAIDADEVVAGDAVVVPSADWDADAPTVAITDVVTITGAGDPAGAATVGSVAISVVVMEPGLEVTVTAPEEP